MVELRLNVLSLNKLGLYVYIIRENSATTM